jgi:putative acetyltransferase
LDKWLENKTVENFHSWIGSTDNYCIVAELDGHVNGVGIVNRRGEIELCYISPGMQRRGIGTAILAALEERARSWGVRKVRLASTVSARAFYEKNGYRPGGTSTCGFGVSRCYPYEKDL